MGRKEMINSFEFGVEGSLTNQAVINLSLVWLKDKAMCIDKVNLHFSIR